jgi:hypothetical protein
LLSAPALIDSRRSFVAMSRATIPRSVRRNRVAVVRGCVRAGTATKLLDDDVDPTARFARASGYHQVDAGLARALRLRCPGDAPPRSCAGRWLTEAPPHACSRGTLYHARPAHSRTLRSRLSMDWLTGYEAYVAEVLGRPGSGSPAAAPATASRRADSNRPVCGHRAQESFNVVSPPGRRRRNRASPVVAVEPQSSAERRSPVDPNVSLTR